ncbi:MAG: SAM-dependent methyltransferase [Planctomycetota bacterium]|jgi:cyclopropane fatty-acyl-phospholipid synthase-like methyltransferase
MLREDVLDKWLYYDATHATHEFCNPTDAATIDELGEVIGLRAGQRVLDIACGHAELLVRWIEQHGIRGTGVDLSPYAFKRAEQRRAERVPDADLELVHMDAAEFATDERFDVVSCIGASWIWNGWEGTLAALRGLVKPGGVIIAGEPFWKGDPPAEYLEADGLTRDMFPALAEYHAHAVDSGLALLWMTESTPTAWDRYEMLQAASADRFAREHPDHEDLAEIRKTRAKSDTVYLRWGREFCGFAIWAFRALEEAATGAV